MTVLKTALRALAAAFVVASCFVALSLPAGAADYPAPKPADWIARDFKFHTGEVMTALKLHYVTIGDPSGEPVLILHGTGGSSARMLTPRFAGALFGPGQPLDAAKYFIVIPDALGHGQSAKPSDGLKIAFPHYNYDDMVLAQHRLVTEGLGIPHLRLVLGNSMGGMHAWIWSVAYPRAMDAVVAMASQPTAMAGRNWMMRRLLVETVRNDPEYRNGNYTTQPGVVRYANAMFGVAAGGGTLAYQQMAPTTAAADKAVDERLAAPFTVDANDFVYQWASARDYDPSPGLEKIEAAVLAIDAADDERNPPETGVLERALQRIRNARMLVIPASVETRGHQTTGNAGFYAPQLRELLDNTSHKAM